MGFSRDIIHRRVAQMDEWGVRVRWSGRRPKLWKSVIDELEVAQERTKNNKTIDVVFCLNYGGRAEIADACAAIAREVRDGRISGDRVTEKMIADHLYNPDIPDCDLVIPTPNSTSCRSSSPTAAVRCCGVPSATMLTVTAGSVGLRSRISPGILESARHSWRFNRTFP